MKTLKYFTMAALALLMTTACSNDENDMTANEPQQAKGITITAQLAPKDDGITRAVRYDETNNKIVSNWVEGETLAVLYYIGWYPKMAIATVTEVNNGVATIQFTVENGTGNNTDCQLIYPADAAKFDSYNMIADVKDYSEMFTEQDGTLSAKLDVRSATATINTTTQGLTFEHEDDNKLAAKYAILKITPKTESNVLDADQLIIEDSDHKLVTTVKPASATSELYLVLPERGTYNFATYSKTIDNNGHYGAKYNKEGSLNTIEHGMYYQVNLNYSGDHVTFFPMDPSQASNYELGFLVGSDGKIHYNAASIANAQTTAVGVVAYVGNDVYSENGTTVGSSTFTGHGLVLSLKNAASNVRWNDANEYSQAYAGNAFVDSDEDLKRSTGVSGYLATKAMATAINANDVYPAAYAAWSYTPAAPTGTTGWFLPTAQQWVKMMQGLGGLSAEDIRYSIWFDNNHTAADRWDAALKQAGNGKYDSMTDYELCYWSSSEKSAERAIFLNVNATGTGDYYGFCLDNYYKGSSDDNFRVRPVFAF